MKICNILKDEIDGEKLSKRQNSRIEHTFNALQNSDSLLEFPRLLDILGHFPPERVIMQFFGGHKQKYRLIPCDTFKKYMRFLVNGTKQDKFKALYYYYTNGQNYIYEDRLVAAIKDEGGDKECIRMFDQLLKVKELTFEVFTEFFMGNPSASPVSTWILTSNFSIFEENQSIPTKPFIISLSSGIPECAVGALMPAFLSIAGPGECCISRSAFQNNLCDILPDYFIDGLFNFLDFNCDGFIDEHEFRSRLSVMYQAGPNEYLTYLFQMFSAKGEAGTVFQTDNFMDCFARFVPPLILGEFSAKFSDIKNFTSLSQLKAWAENYSAFTYLIKFIKALINVVFGLLPPTSEVETQEIILLWMYYMLKNQLKLGSQWYIIPTISCPCLCVEIEIQTLRLPNSSMRTHSLRHPVSMYNGLFSQPPALKQSESPVDAPTRNPRRSISYEDGLNRTIDPKHTSKHRTITQWISEHIGKRREAKAAERESSTRNPHNHLTRQAQSVYRSNCSTPHDELSPCASAQKSREQSMSRVRGAEDANGDSFHPGEPLIAVDRRLAYRLKSWNKLGAHDGGAHIFDYLKPSYLINYLPTVRKTPKEVLEISALEVSVRWTNGIKLRAQPTQDLITAVDPPRNTYFYGSPSAIPVDRTKSRAVSAVSGMSLQNKRRLVSTCEKSSPDIANNRYKYSTSVDSSQQVRKISSGASSPMTLNEVSGNTADCIYVPTQKLSAQSLRFAFSRCHRVWEVVNAICCRLTDYRNCDLKSDNYRVWLVSSSAQMVMRSRQKLNSPTATVGNATVSENKSLSSSCADLSPASPNSSAPCAKRIDLRTVGDQPLGRFLAENEPMLQKELLNPERLCHSTFEIIIEARVQFLCWPFGQRATYGVPFVGLKNLGNTCYLNSTIQCLRVTPSLTQKIEHHLTPETRLAEEYLKLLERLDKSYQPVNPYSMRSVFVEKRPSFATYDQQDAQEFLTVFLDCLNDELKRKSLLGESHIDMKGKTKHKSRSASVVWNTFCLENDSPVTHIFYGLCESRCEFQSCSHSSCAYEPFSNLTLPLPDDPLYLIKLTVVPSYGAVPEVIQLEIPKSGDFECVRKDIAKRYNCSSSQVFLGDLNTSGTLIPIGRTKKRLNVTRSQRKRRNLDTKGELWAFIIPEQDASLPSKETLDVIIQNRTLVLSDTPLLQQTALTPQLHGTPLVVCVPKTATNEDLYAMVDKCLRRTYQPRDRLELHQNCLRTISNLKNATEYAFEPDTRMCSAIEARGSDKACYVFSLKYADKTWWRCSRCPWPKMCRGCHIPHNCEQVSLTPSNDSCVYLAADWNLVAMTNDYQPAQEAKRKVIEYRGFNNTLQLKDLLDTFFDEETVNEDNGIECDSCRKRTSCIKRTRISVLPDVLLIALKKFQLTRGSWQKCTRPVDFPLTSLNMSSYLLSDARSDGEIYDLYGVVNHTGTLDEGHYYAFVRSEDGRWFRVNDIECTEVKKEDVVTPDAYVLFYQRRRPDQGCRGKNSSGEML